MRPFRSSLRRFALCVTLALSACSSAPHKPIAERTALRIAPISGATANDILFRAIGLVGTPYRYGGNTPQSGFDCSGLVDYVFRDAAGIPLPRTADAIGE